MPFPFKFAWLNAIQAVRHSHRFQLQPYIFVHLQNFDKDTLGDVFEDSGLKWKTMESGEVAISSISSDKGEDSTTSLLLEASTQLTAEGLKALFVCFQIAINNTAIQLSVKNNELNHNKAAKKAAFAKNCKKPRPASSSS
jgi:hypothetical protein